jgi:hypothetical protein
MNIQVKLDVTKIDKTKLFQGNKGTYLDAVIFLKDTPDQYGNNGMIVQSVSADERAQGIKGAILGNVKVMQQQQQPTQAVSGGLTVADVEKDSLPF